MHVEQYTNVEGAGWSRPIATMSEKTHAVGLLFGRRERLTSDAVAEVRAALGGARLVVASTSGEIAHDRVLDDALVLTVLTFRETDVEVGALAIAGTADSRDAGRRLAATLPASTLSGRPLRHVLVFSDGLAVNGTGLVAGLAELLPSGVTVTGGLAGDGAAFSRTLVGLDGVSDAPMLVAVGLYSERLVVGFGSLGGWDAFGPERKVDASAGNVLQTLDGEPALDVYKRYLGEHAAGLPANALRFPLSVAAPGAIGSVTRTILSIDEATGQMTFAGDVPVGSKVRLMMANAERLIDGAEGAADRCVEAQALKPEFAMLISCVGRKIFLGQRTEEEVEVVASRFAGIPMAGFYSYGELGPRSKGAPCELHNQTMSITTFSEA